VALDHLRHVARELRDPLQLRRRRPDADEGGDRVAERRRFDVGAEPRDHTARSEPLKPLGDRGRREVDLAPQRRDRDTAVLLERFQDLAVQRVQT
jgi:hypothetical protein